VTVDLELRADLNSEDDDGLNWALLRDAVDPSKIHRGAVVRAGSERFAAWVEIVAVDSDGQVHFRQLNAAEVEARNPISTSGSGP
jgi:hypothetical protein